MIWVIIPTCGANGCFDDTLEALVQNYKARYGSLKNLVVVVVSNTDETSSLERVGANLRRWKLNGLDYRLYEVPRSIGYVRAVDIGWRLCEAADNDYVAMLNDDVVIKGDWVTPLISAVAHKPGVLAGASMKHLGPDGYGYSDSRCWKPQCHYAYVEGWCWMARGDTLRDAGGVVDLGFKGSYCEDCDLSIRVAESGGTLNQVDLPLEHKSHSTLQLTPEVQKMWDRNRQYLREKWDLVNGGPKHACNHTTDVV